MSIGNGIRWIVALLVLGAVAACGRAGPVEPPPGSVVEPASQQQGKAEKEPVEDKPFVLDGLL